MYDAKKVIIGLIVFLALITSPLWYIVIGGKTTDVPEPKIVTEEKQCVEVRQYMREKHMDLLDDWKESVVREGNRTYVASGGKEYNISLTDTCMDCHSNKAEFCDLCHNYLGVEPNCWNCHIPPDEINR